jgi:hypothetical protein
MISDLQPKDQEKLVQRHIDALMEHFDAVQIMATSADLDGTSNVFMGGGNWFARQGMAHDFIRQDKARTDAREISKAIDPPNDAGEEWRTA